MVRRAYLSISVALALALLTMVIYLARGSGPPPSIASPGATAGVFENPTAATVEALRASPDGLSPLSTGQACPVSAYVRSSHQDFPAGPALGDIGPLWVLWIVSPLRAGTVQNISWVALDRSGPYLVRGRQLDGPEPVYFSSDPLAAAPSDIDTVLPRQVSLGGSRWVTWPGSIAVHAPGCYGLSIASGQAPPEIIVVRVLGPND
jgi:hypothetical protein